MTKVISLLRAALQTTAITDTTVQTGRVTRGELETLFADLLAL